MLLAEDNQAKGEILRPQKFIQPIAALANATPMRGSEEIPRTSPCREARQRGSLAPRGSRSVARHCANSARQDEARRNRPETVPNPENYPSQNGWRSACPRQWLPARCSPSRAESLLSTRPSK